MGDLEMSIRTDYKAVYKGPVYTNYFFSQWLLFSWPISGCRCRSWDPYRSDPRVVESLCTDTQSEKQTDRQTYSQQDRV